VIIEDAFEVDAPVEHVWILLEDIPRIATCIPNAKITAVIDLRTYRANINVKIGPVNVGYNATIVVDALDAAAHRAQFTIKGDELRGRGGVEAVVTSEVLPAGGKSRVTLHADAKISGIVATLGGRLIEGVAKKTIASFAQNLSKLLQADV
jgi:uncharacterized protein